MFEKKQTANEHACVAQVCVGGVQRRMLAVIPVKHASRLRLLRKLGFEMWQEKSRQEERSLADS